MSSVENSDTWTFRCGSVGFFVNVWRDGFLEITAYDLSDVKTSYKPHKVSVYQYKRVVSRMNADD